MSSEDQKKYEWRMLEMPNGISTSNGNWYSISREGIEKYIPGLLDKVELETIIRNADEWHNSANALALIVYLALPFTGLDPVLAFLASLAFFMIWYLNTSAFASVGLSKLIRIINSDGLLYVLSASAFIYFAWQEQYTTLWLGVVLFFLYKVGLLNLILKLYASKKEEATPTRADRVLNMMLIRYGMREGMIPEKVRQMQDELLKTANYHKTRKKSKD